VKPAAPSAIGTNTDRRHIVRAAISQGTRLQAQSTRAAAAVYQGLPGIEVELLTLDGEMEILLDAVDRASPQAPGGWLVSGDSCSPYLRRVFGPQ